MARILLSAPGDRPFSNGPHLAAALRDLGHQVALFDFRSATYPTSEMLETARAFRPVLHICWKGERYDPDAFGELRKLGTFTVMTHPDETCPDWLPPLARASDLFCTQFTGMKDVFRRAGIERLGWQLEGVTLSFFEHGEITAAEHQRYDCEVVTIGTVDRIPEYRKRLYALNRLIREGFHVKWWGRPMSFRRNSLRDWMLPARKAWGGGLVWNAEFAKACHCAKVFLTLPRCPEVVGGLSNRAFWVTGIGAFSLTLHKEGIEQFFEPGREVAVFRDEEEMVEKVRYYLGHDEEREAIARAGCERTRRDYTNQVLFARLLRQVRDWGGPDLTAG